MKILLLLLLIFEARSINLDNTKKQSTSLSSNRYTTNKKNPQQILETVVRIYDINDFSKKICGGVIVAEDWILTTASCFGDKIMKDVRVVSTFILNSQIATVAEIINHDDYNDISLANDVALIKLKDPLNRYYHLKTAIVRSRSRPLLENEVVTIALTNKQNYESAIFNSSPQCLEKDDTDVRHRKTTTNMFCVDSNRRNRYLPRHVCPIQSGAPAFDLANELVGLSSWGYQDCQKFGTSSVFTNVAKYNQWIKSVLSSTNYESDILESIEIVSLNENVREKP